jgi:hypothetical protein
LRNIYDTNDHWYLPFDVITIWLFPPSWLITGFVTRVTRQVALVEQDLFTHPDNLSLPWFLVWFVLLNILFSLFVLFLLAILLHVLRFMASDYPFRIFRLFWIPNEWKKEKKRHHNCSVIHVRNMYVHRQRTIHFCWIGQCFVHKVTNYDISGIFIFKVVIEWIFYKIHIWKSMIHRNLLNQYFKGNQQEIIMINKFVVY